MPTVVNIAGTSPVDDPSYRYKMPLVYGKVEGRGNGIKTVIPNVSEVSRSLHRDAGEVTKFFGCELGAQTKNDEKNDRYVVNGSHSDGALQGMIHKYIEAFVLCPECGLPETHYKIKEGCIFHRCAACGAKEMVDMEHKLCTYILAQHKKEKKMKKEQAKKDKAKPTETKEPKDKKKGSDDEKKVKKKKKPKEGDDAKKSSKKSSKKKKKDKDDKPTGFNDEKKLADDVDELSITSENEVNDADAIVLAISGVQTFLNDNPNATAAQVAEVVVNQQMSSALKSHDKVHILLRAIITPTFYKDKQIQKYASFVEKVTLGNPIMERHLISAIEFICIEKPKNFPVMLKQLYDEEVLEEEVILTWAFDGRSGYTCEAVDEEKRAALRGEAEPFITWLQDEDDSSGEDSD
mmetsp:Transcript_28390/g.33635  ORF Transcript_28390/g.33635 Transcript_28390/m.33635 type:complete len:406 (-) Transcript_28390:134-1351(-)|eukprot:CAMPEP_0198263822 /NCGR_PEP_ID=MMETSP1447-20131203/13810_1 /TAXON_ID=420782 /ORGANISM="Chaetoceros dichaeta, Strain CCMP1751" /LENGTH=405 /DNA_ID=CAMNT_0043952561 /DNA_START=447 /DNA_END=1664 /DNA_ORIENTATION=-